MELFDVAIIGSGPAGLTAAIYASRANLKTILLAGQKWGGQLMLTTTVENFPGFPEVVTGAEFADRLRRQAERFEVDGDYRVVRTSDGSEYRSWAVLLALGSTYRKLDIPGEMDFIGAGVHFCATCDGAFYRDKDVLVVGGGNSAGEESIFLTRFAHHVTIATRDDNLSASKVVIEKVEENPKIDLLPNVVPAELKGRTSSNRWCSGTRRPANGRKSSRTVFSFSSD